MGYEGQDRFNKHAFIKLLESNDIEEAALQVGISLLEWMGYHSGAAKRYEGIEFKLNFTS
jgi:hypothetical protein